MKNLLYKSIKDSKILVEGNTISINNIESQKISKMDKIRFNKLELKLVIIKDKNNIKGINYQLKLVKNF